jgi:Xaa-Pro dipeptidase
MTLVMTATDVEQRIDLDAMRKYKLQRVREQIENYDLRALLYFDLDNIRYITGTHLADWTPQKTRGQAFFE